MRLYRSTTGGNGQPTYSDRTLFLLNTTFHTWSCDYEHHHVQIWQSEALEIHQHPILTSTDTADSDNDVKVTNTMSMFYVIYNYISFLYTEKLSVQRWRTKKKLKNNLPRPYCKLLLFSWQTTPTISLGQSKVNTITKQTNQMTKLKKPNCTMAIHFNDKIQNFANEKEVKDYKSNYYHYQNSIQWSSNLICK